MKRQLILAVLISMAGILTLADSIQARPSLDITTGLVGYWPFDELSGQIAADNTLNGNDVILGSTAAADPSDPLWTGGMIDGGLDFDGFNDFASAGDSPVFELPQYTWAMWVNGDNVPGGSTLRQPLSNAGQQFLFSWDHQNSSFRTAAAHQSGAAFPHAQILTPLSANTWYHIAATYDGTTIKVYLNGNLESSAAAGSPNAAVGDLTIGSSHTIANFFDGKVDEVRVYDRALSDTDLQELFSFSGIGNPPVLDPIGNQSMSENESLNVGISATDPDVGETITLSAIGLPGFGSLVDNGDGTGTISFNPGGTDSGTYQITVVAKDPNNRSDTETFDLIVNEQADFTTGLVGYWPFDELSGQIAADNTLNSNDVVLGSSTGTDSGDPAWTFGMIGGGLDFDGLNDFGSAGDSPVFELPQYTWAMWVNSDNVPGTTKDSMPINNANDHFVFSWDHFNPGFVASATHKSGTTFESAQIVTPLLANTWYHVAGTYDGTNIKIYLNGNLESGAASGPPNVVVGDLNIGASNILTNFFDGKIDEVRVYNRALSDIDIQGLFSFSPAGNPPVLNAIADQVVPENGSLNVGISATDPDIGDTITLSALGLPSFGSLVDNGDGTGTISFNPGSLDSGSYPIAVVAIDNNALLDSKQFTLTVTNVTDLAIELLVNEGSTSQFNVFSIDGSTSVTYTASGLPAFASFVDNADGTGTLTASPNFSDAGEYSGIQITGTEGPSSDTWDITITVLDTNQPPVLDPVGNQVALADTTLVVNVTASDPDGNASLQLFANSLPAFASFVDNGSGSGTLTISPTTLDAGFYPGVEIVAFDGDLTDNEFISITVQIPDITTGLVGYWPFDELTGQIAADISGNGNDAVLGPTLGIDGADPQWAAGMIGGALDFDGINDFANAGDSPVFELPIYTWAMWINGDNAPGTSFITQPMSNAEQQFLFSWDHSVPSFKTAAAHQSGASFPNAQIATPLSGNTWYHIVATYDGVNIRVYLNGNLEATAAAPAPNVGVGNLVLGSEFDLIHFFPGKIDEFRIYDRALSDTDIQGLFAFSGAGGIGDPPVLDPIANQSMDENTSLNVSVSATDPDVGDTITLSAPGLPVFGSLTDNGDGTGTISFNPGSADSGTYQINIVARDSNNLTDSESFELVVNDLPDITTGLVGYWPFDELTGQVAADNSGNGNNIILGSSAGADPSDPIWTGGVIGGGLDFDGTDDFANAGDSPVFELPQYTWAMWVNGDNAPGTLVDTQPLSNANDQFVFSWDHTIPQFVASATHKSGNLYRSAQISTPLSAGVWYHIAGTYDGTNIKIYLNGVLEGSVASGPPNVVPGNLHVGQSSILSNDYYFPGKIDDLRIYNRALTDGDMLELFTFSGGGAIGNPPVIAPIADQSMDENTSLNVSISATDADPGDTITLSAPGLPVFGSLTDNGDGTGTISFNPGSADSGTYQISVLASDSINLDSETFELVVNDVPDIATGLVGYWPFDELTGQVAVDNSANGNDVILGPTLGADSADPTWTAGMIGGSLDFDGIDDFANAGDSPDFQLPQYTWSLWVNGDNVPGTLVDSQPLSNANDQFVFTWDHVVSNFVKSGTHKSGTSYKSAQISTPLSAGVWYHIAGSYDGTRIKIYLNGNLERSVISGPPNAVPGNLHIGASSILTNFFPGKIDDLRIYDRALTDGDIQGLFAFSGAGAIGNPPVLDPIADQSTDENTSLNVSISATDPDAGDTITLSAPGLPVFGSLTDNGDGTGTVSFNPGSADSGTYLLAVVAKDSNNLSDIEFFELVVNDQADITTGLVGYWPFDELTGQVAADNSGNGNNIILGSSAGIDPSDPIWTGGVIGGGLDFDGIDDFANAGDSPVFELPQYTWAMWVNGDNAPGTLVDTQPLSNANDQFVFSWDHTNPGFVASATHKSRSTYASAQISTPLSAGVWYHIAGTYDGANIKIYLNGVLEGSVASGAPNVVSGNLHVGQSSILSNDYYFPGKIDDLRIYNRALTEVDLAQLVAP